MTGTTGRRGRTGRRTNVDLDSVVSAITFTQTSILNYTYFLNNIISLLGVGG